jgi:hypothetical protein
MTESRRAADAISCRSLASCDGPALSKEAALSVAQLIRIPGALAHALSTKTSTSSAAGRGRVDGSAPSPRTGCSSRRSTVAGAQVESLADLLRELDHHNDITVAYKAFYNGSRAKS